MKKTLLASILILGSAGLTFAATAGDNNGQCPKAKCEQSAQCQGQGKDDAKCMAPFEGLNLTADQQTKLEALRAECAQKKAEARSEAKAKKQAGREAMGEKRKEMLAKVKDILTPEQYVQFLENSFVNGTNRMKAEGRRVEGKINRERKKLERRAEAGQHSHPRKAQRGQNDNK